MRERQPEGSSAGARCVAFSASSRGLRASIMTMPPAEFARKI